MARSHKGVLRRMENMAQGMVMNPTYMMDEQTAAHSRVSLILVNWSKLSIILASYESSAQII